MRNKLLLLLAFVLAASPVLATELKVHYHRYEGDYDGWGLHLWGAVDVPTYGTFMIDGVEYDWQNPYSFDETDDFGVWTTIPIAYPDTELGFIVHKSHYKDPGPDRFFGDFDEHNEIWLLQGVMQIFTQNPGTDPRIQYVAGDGVRTIQVMMSREIADHTGRFVVRKDGVAQDVVSVTGSGQNFTITLVDPIDITAFYEVLDNVTEDATVLFHNFPVDDYVYDGEDLGFVYTPAQTTFKLWSPTANSVNVLIFDAPIDTPGDEAEEPVVYPMTRVGGDGVLRCVVTGDLKGKYYLYEVTTYGETHSAPDPYSIALSTNSMRSIIIALNDSDPPGWEADTYATTDSLEDTVVYELHVRDLTIDDTWNGTEEIRGKFLGLIESGTTFNGMPTGFDHILDLGVTAVHFLPMYDFSSVDETNPRSRNWGYDPFAYNVPEGSYATDPEGITRIREMKEMIQGFHDAGLQVIMDVVYPHTHYIGKRSVFDVPVPKYYYLINEDGSYVNATGCGNTIDFTKPMVRRFVLQSVRYWVEEYHMDGFRFDQMGLIDTELMEEIATMAHGINPDAIIYGEPWGGMGAPILTAKGDQRGKGFGVFNDDIRNAIRGDTDGKRPGYAMGNLDNWEEVQVGVPGSIDAFTDDPSETMNYVSAHDNYTWFDKIERTMEESTEDDKIAMNKLGIAIVLTSQGIPFIHAGSEFRRTKRVPGVSEEEIRNSYNASDEVNKLDWARKYSENDVYEYYRGLIELRKARKEFRLPTADDIRNNLRFWDDLESPNGTMTFTLSDVTPGDGWGEIIVSYNPTGEVQHINMPDGNWAVVVDDEQAGASVIEVIAGGGGDQSFGVAPYSAKVLYETDVSIPGINLFQNPALPRNFHFAINVTSGPPQSIVLELNGAALPLMPVEENSWYASQQTPSTDTNELALTVDDIKFVRYFSIESF